MPGQPDKTFEHNRIRIETTNHFVPQQTGFEDSDFHVCFLVSSAGNITAVSNRLKYSLDKLINVIIFYRLFEMISNSAIVDAPAYVIK
jgi:hypothetical protein